MRYFHKTTHAIYTAFLVLLFLPTSIFAQGDVIWKKNFGGGDVDHYRAVASVSDGDSRESRR